MGLGKRRGGQGRAGGGEVEEKWEVGVGGRGRGGGGRGPWLVSIISSICSLVVCILSLTHTDRHDSDTDTDTDTG